MKHRREFLIAMVLVGLAGVNYFYMIEIFFSGPHLIFFRSENQILFGWTSVILIIFANIVLLVGFFYLVRPRASGSTQQQGYRV